MTLNEVLVPEKHRVIPAEKIIHNHRKEGIKNDCSEHLYLRKVKLSVSVIFQMLF